MLDEKCMVGVWYDSMVDDVERDKERQERIRTRRYLVLEIDISSTKA